MQPGAATAAALASLARPEAILLVPLLAAARPLTLRRVLVFVAVTVAVLAPFVAFSYATVGRPLPATAMAKVEGGLLGWLAGLREPGVVTWLGRPWAFGVEWMRWLFATHPLLPLAVPAAAVAWWRCGRALGVVALGLVAHPLGMALLAPYRGPAFQEGRYSIHLLPLAVVVLAAALGGSFRPRPLALAAPLALALVTLAPAAERYAWGVQNINAMQVHLGRWLDANTPPGATLAVNDIGAIAFFSRRSVVDLMGLVTPEILPYRREGEDAIIRYVAARCPDYVVIFPSWFPRLAARRDLLSPVYAVRLERIEVSGGPEMVVYRLARCAV
jgi:arabinofuranosyltransferase